MGGWENEKCDQSWKQREMFSHETLQYHFVGAICYNTEQGLREVSIFEVSQSSLLLAISFELRSAICVYIVILILLYHTMHICEYKDPHGIT